MYCVIVNGNISPYAHRVIGSWVAKKDAYDWASANVYGIYEVVPLHSFNDVVKAKS